MSYELIEGGIGYAFCVRITCKKFTYNVDPFFYAKSFSNITHGKWEDCPQNTQDKLLSDTIRDLKIYG